MEKATALALKIGDPASVSRIHLATSVLAGAYKDRGFLDAKAAPTFPKDPANHTVDLSFSVIPGEIYHLAAIDFSKLPASMQATMVGDSKLRPGVVADENIVRELAQIAGQQRLSLSFNISITTDHEHHLATLIVTPRSKKP